MSSAESGPPQSNMDSSKATSAMVLISKTNLEQEKDGDFFEEDLEREEAKEEEYDYFHEENQNNAQAYHVLDDDGQEEEDLEELDEEEKAQRHREMFKEFKEKIEKEKRPISTSSDRDDPITKTD